LRKPTKRRPEEAKEDSESVIWRVLSNPKFLDVAALAPTGTWGDSVWVSLLRPDMLEHPGIRSLLADIGRRPRLAKLTLDSELTNALWDAWVVDHSAWPLARLALWSNPPAGTIDLTSAPLEGAPEDADGSYLAFREILCILTGTPATRESLRHLAGEHSSTKAAAERSDILRESLLVMTNSRALLEPDPQSSLAERFKSTIAVAQRAMPTHADAASQLLQKVSEAISQLPAGTAMAVFDHPASN
jgi:hypothetical protein